MQSHTPFSIATLYGPGWENRLADHLDRHLVSHNSELEHYRRLLRLANDVSSKEYRQHLLGKTAAVLERITDLVAAIECLSELTPDGHDPHIDQHDTDRVYHWQSDIGAFIGLRVGGDR